MDQVLTDLSSEALRAAIAKNLYSAFTELLPRIPGGDRFSCHGTTGYFTGVPAPFFNGVVRPRFLTMEADAGIACFVEEARIRNVPMLWQVAPGSTPDDLDARLRAHGFQTAGRLSGMAMDLAGITAESLPAGLTIERIRDWTSLREAAAVTCRVYGMPPSQEEPWAQIAAAGLGADAAVQNFAGRLQGRVVATSLLYCACGVAGIYNIATLGDARGRGIGRAITLAPLLDARARGYRVAILHASEMGFPVYRRLDFQEYCEILQYVWSPEIGSG